MLSLPFPKQMEEDCDNDDADIDIQSVTEDNIWKKEKCDWEQDSSCQTVLACGQQLRYGLLDSSILLTEFVLSPKRTTSGQGQLGLLAQHGHN